MPSLFGKVLGTAAQVAGSAAQAAAQQVMVGSSAQAPPPSPPPPKVWCVTLRRKPVLTPQDEPEIGACEKLCTKLLVIPFALVTYLIGWIISLLFYLVACCCCPVFGPYIFTALAATRLETAQSLGTQVAAERTKEDAQKAAGMVVCLARFYWSVYWNMIRPLSMFCEW
eukprot:TRINITY_DN60939_c0_g1_i1.p1 TRINITY_DN60939_c0_g1~~TRINITY_DN60939_c0_g1_i1.p1  ORF type:complete len:169 (-),score=28.70 TRINITY_DN60939_c0_g1_i1:36-542(-)